MPDKKVINNKNKKGFTLVELLVVISIIGILTVIGVVSFSSAQKKSRDVKRKAELNALSKALMVYYADYGVFPTGGASFFDGEFSVGSYIYMKKTPKESKSSMPGFCYALTNSNKSFGLFAKLENSADMDCVSGVGYTFASGNCSGVNYCYAVTSPNILATEFIGVGITQVKQVDP